jgi:hypothetical protein
MKELNNLRSEVIRLNKTSQSLDNSNSNELGTLKQQLSEALIEKSKLENKVSLLENLKSKADQENSELRSHMGKIRLTVREEV